MDMFTELQIALEGNLKSITFDVTHTECAIDYIANGLAQRNVFRIRRHETMKDFDKASKRIIGQCKEVYLLLQEHGRGNRVIE